jgi:hypothetical protein
VSETGDDRCVHWPQTCADHQALMDTYCLPCDFCRFGPPEPPTRESEGLGIDIAEAQEQIAKTERGQAERLRNAVVASLGFEEADGG